MTTKIITKRFGTSLLALASAGLIGCTADAHHGHDDMATVNELRHVEVIKGFGGEEKSINIKIITEDGAEPILITSDDPESPEIKQAIADLKKQGIEIDMDVSRHLAKLEALEAIEGIHIEKIEGLEGLAELKELEGLEGLAKLEMLEAHGNHIMIFKTEEGEFKIDGEKVIRLEDGKEWTSEDGTLHVIKKVEGDVTIVTSGEGDKVIKKVLIRDKADEAGKMEKIEKKIIVIEKTDDTSTGDSIEDDEMK